MIDLSRVSDIDNQPSRRGAGDTPQESAAVGY
jgi:hypothetical protein